MKTWDKIAQSFYQCVDSALLGLKREKYITTDQYEQMLCELQAIIEVNNQKKDKNAQP